MHHYTYELFLKDSTRYIGVRSCKCAPELDEYFGSSSDPYVREENVVKKEILRVFDSREKAERYEEWQHRRWDVVNNPRFRNRKIGITGFSMAGTTHSAETRLKQSTKRSNRSGFTGVNFDKKNKSFKASIGFRGVEYKLGTYSKASTAAEAYQLALAQIEKTGELNLDVLKKFRKENGNKRGGGNNSKQLLGKISNRNTSGQVGVYFYRKNRKWRAQIKFDGVRRDLGYYSSFSTAAKVYNTALEEIRKTGKLDCKKIRARFKENQ